MIRVLIADDHPVVRRGVIEILTDDPEIQVVGEASSIAELMELARTCPCDVLLLDVSMPGRGGIEALRDLKHEHPKLRVLVLSVYAEEQYAVRALKAGADGYLTKGSASDQLLTVVRRIAGGRRYVSEALAERLADAIQPGADTPPHERLSDREFLVMRAIAAGQTVGGIARDLNLSVKTISTHRARLLQKMGLRTNAEIMRYALDRRLLD